MIATQFETDFLDDLNVARADPTAYGVKLGIDLSMFPPAPPCTMERTVLTASRYMSKYRAEIHQAPLDHYGPPTNGVNLSPLDRVRLTGFQFQYCVEAAAFGPKDPAGLLDVLIRDEGVPSLGHRKALLGATTPGMNQVGVGVWPELGQFAQGAYISIHMVQGTPPSVDWGSFLESIYQLTLGHGPSGTGFFTALGFLTANAPAPAPAPQGMTAYGLETNPLRNRLLDIITAYRAVLNRVPQQAEIDSWTAALQSGKTVTDLWVGLEGSYEYLALSQTLN